MLYSRKPLNGEDIRVEKPPYRYVLWGASAPFWVILASSRQIVRRLLLPLASSAPDLDLVGVAVDVPAIVEVLAEPHDESRRKSELGENWILTSVHAKTPAFRGAIETVSYVGEALHRGPLFVENLDRISATSVGVRTPDAKRSEIGTISDDGAIRVSSAEKLPDFDRFLAHLMRASFLSTFELRRTKPRGRK